MERKYIILIVGVISAICVVSGIIGAMAYKTNQDKLQMRMTFILLSTIPGEADFDIQIDSGTNWIGAWAIDDQGGAESGSGGTIHSGKGEKAGASYTITAAGTLTLTIKRNGEIVYQQATATIGVYVTGQVEAEKPFEALLWLAFLI